ncbi:hypothetical protein LTR15_007332 [Elasticomyces elasticus]|nr:hypothetical protein LTR15_007332 [Elasticomyces elasticus]
MELTLLLLQVSSAFAVSFAPRLPGYLSKREEISVNSSDYPAYRIEIPVDHYNVTDERKYENRYWINAEYYRSGGPVFYFDAGEQNASPLVPYFLYEAAGPSSLMTLARRLGGVAIIFEHRFYGDPETGSFPFPMNSSGMPDEGYEAYTYLTTEQALQDPVYFAHNFQPPGLEQYWSLLSPDYTPWIWLGGSYPGIRGAHMRVRNPETFYATWASSAPTEAAVDMWTYYAQAERSMTRNCSADYTHVTNYVDSVLASGTIEEQTQLKLDLYTAVLSSAGGLKPDDVNRTEAEGLSNSDVGNYLQLPLSFYQYYGFEASVKPFCDNRETFNQTGVSTTDNGGTAPALASESGIAITHNISAAWNAFLVGIAEIDYDSIPYTGDPIGGNSWTYISLDLFQAGCNETFPVGLPPSPNVEAANKYGGWHINPSNIMFSSGEYDPWRALSPASIETGSPNRTTSQIIPACNTPPAKDSIFGIIYRDQVHVSDMRALLNSSDINHQNFSTVGFSSPISTEPFYAGVSLFQSALEEWLPCFGNGTYGRGMLYQAPVGL